MSSYRMLCRTFALLTAFYSPSGWLTAQDSGSSANQYAVTHFAGGQGGLGSADGTGSAARFNYPGQLWGDGTNLFVSDNANNTIRKIEIATGTVTTVLGTPNASGLLDGRGSDARVSATWGMWGDGTNLYFTNAFKVRRLQLATGDVTTFAGSQFGGALDGVGSSARFTSPGGIWGDGAYLYVIDAHSIRRISIATAQVTTLSGASSSIGYVDGAGSAARFGFLLAIWGDGSSLYAVETPHDATDLDRRLRVRRIVISTGEVSTFTTGPSVYITAVAGATGIWGDRDFLYLTEGGRNSITRIDTRTGEISTVVGTPGSADAIDGPFADARFRTPAGLWGQGSILYVSDKDSHTIRKVDLGARAVTTLAGLAQPRSTATVVLPWDSWGDGANLYVTDPGKGEIHKVVLATGDVTTAAKVEEAGYIWGDGPHLYFSSGAVIYKLEIATGSISKLADLSTRQNPFFRVAGIWGDEGKLYVRDQLGSILKVDLTTGSAETWVTLRSGGFEGGSIWGAEASLYVLDDCVRRISIATGGVSACLGAAAFPFGGDLWGDGTNLYIATSNTIFRMAIADGEVTAIAGSPEFPGLEDGVGSAARFDAARGIWGDGTNLYVGDTAAIRKLEPVPRITSGSSYSFTLAERGGVSVTTTGSSPSSKLGYARTQPKAGPAAPGGIAISSFRHNDLLVSEASIPASSPILQGRIYSEVAGAVTTGLAIANPNADAAIIAFYFTDASGQDFGRGTIVLSGGGQIARFLDQSPFYISTPFSRPVSESTTFTFSSSVPVSVVAVRGYLNERSEFLTSTLPVADMTTFRSEVLLFPHFADGDGWGTQVILVNPGDDTITGTIRFFSSGTFTDAALPVSVTLDGRADSVFTYTIAPRSSKSFRSSGAVSVRGSARVVPDPGGRSPSALEIFSFSAAGIRVTEVGMPTIPATTSARLYAEMSGDFESRQAGSLRTAIAVLNPSASATVEVTYELFTLDGHATNRSARYDLAANSQQALFIDSFMLPRPPGLPIRGTLRITSTGPVSVFGLRGVYTSRGDLLFAATSEVASMGFESGSEWLFPQFVDGGGYTTQFILLGSGDQVSHGELRFFTQSGQPMTIDFR